MPSQGQPCLLTRNTCVYERLDVRTYARPIVELLSCHDAFREPGMSIVELTYHQFACRKWDHDASTLQYHQVDAIDLMNGELIHDAAKQLCDVRLARLVVLLLTSHEGDEIGVLGVDHICDVTERQDFVHLEACSNVVDR